MNFKRNVDRENRKIVREKAVVFNPLAGHIASTEWEKPKGDLEKISPPVGKENKRKRINFRRISKAQEILRLVNKEKTDIDLFGSRF